VGWGTSVRVAGAAGAAACLLSSLALPSFTSAPTHCPTLPPTPFHTQTHLVVSTITLGAARSASSRVSSALTARMASAGSDPPTAALLRVGRAGG
jgi:hypothetical protein